MALPAHSLQHLEPRQARQHDVEDDQVLGDGIVGEALRTIVGDRHGKALGLQILADHLGEFDVVVDHQDLFCCRHRALARARGP